MSRPSRYNRQNSFTTLASVSPSTPYTGAELDAEFNAVKVTLDEILANLARLQRDDGRLVNQSVGPDQLAASLSIGINPPSAWVTAEPYALYDTVFSGTILYKCLAAHTSGTFADDLAAGKWEQLAEFNTVAVDDGSITTAKLADLVVVSTKLANSAATTNKIADLAIITAKIADLAVTNAKIAANAVATDNIQDEAVTTAKLGAAALRAIGALTPAADRMAYFTDTNAAALATLTAAGRALLDDASATAQRATLGLGDSATKNVGTAAGTVAAGDDARFNAGYPPGHLYGLTLSNGSDATNDINIAAGSARDGADTADMVLASAITKRLDAAWAVGSGSGGLDTGSIGDKFYYVWLIKRADTGVVDVLFSASATSPTMPANYTLKRRIGAFNRASGAIRPFVQKGDHFWLVTAAQDMSNVSAATTAYTATLTAPPNMRAVVIIASGTLCQTRAWPTFMNDPGYYFIQNGGGAQFEIEVDASSQIKLINDGAGASSYKINEKTLGWIDGSLS